MSNLWNSNNSDLSSSKSKASELSDHQVPMKVQRTIDKNVDKRDGLLARIFPSE